MELLLDLEAHASVIVPIRRTLERFVRLQKHVLLERMSKWEKLIVSMEGFPLEQLKVVVAIAHLLTLEVNKPQSTTVEDANSV